MFILGDIVIILKDFPWSAGLRKGQKARVTGVYTDHDENDIFISILDIDNKWTIDSRDAELYDHNNIDWWSNVNRSRRTGTP